MQECRRRYHRQHRRVDPLRLRHRHNERADVHAVHRRVWIVLFDPGETDHGIDVTQDALCDDFARLVYLRHIHALAVGHVIESRFEGFCGLVADLGSALDLLVEMDEASLRGCFAIGIRERFDVFWQISAFVGVDGDHRQPRFPQTIDEPGGGDDEPSVALDLFVHLAGQTGPLGAAAGADGVFRLQKAELLPVLFLDDDFGGEEHSLGEVLDRDQFLHGFFVSGPKIARG